jgi:ABC-2 type transport system permease protein
VKKYFETAKIMFKTQMAYRFDIITSMVYTISKILLAYVLWGAIFGKQSMIAGFTFNSMLSYYIISSFLSQLDQSSNIGWQIAGEIRNGTFSKYIIRPMGIFRYFTAQTAGVSAFLLSFNLIAAIIWVFIFRINFTISSNGLTILSALSLVLLGLLFMIQINYFIGILAFKFLDTSIFMMIKDNISQFVTGSLIPLTLLPPEIIRVMTFFPFYYISYLPSMLLLGRNQNEIIAGIVILSFWNIAFGVINSTTYKRLKSVYDGVGI